MSATNRDLVLWQKYYLELESAKNKLSNFVRELLLDYPDIGNWDGFQIQELAEKHGILEPIIENAPCGDACRCLEFFSIKDFANGVECYRLAGFLLNDAAQQSVQRTAGSAAQNEHIE